MYVHSFCSIEALLPCGNKKRLNLVTSFIFYTKLHVVSIRVSIRVLISIGTYPNDIHP